MGLSDMKEKLLKFFQEYQNLFKNGMSTGDADGVLMRLMGIIEEDDIKEVLANIHNNFYER
jgi:hypothetical protein